MITVRLFTLASPDLRKAGDSEMLPIAWFSVQGKNRGGSARFGLRLLKALSGIGKLSTVGVLRLRASSVPCHAVNLRGASLRMTILFEVEGFTGKIDEVTGSQDDDFVGILRENIEAS